MGKLSESRFLAICASNKGFKPLVLREFRDSLNLEGIACEAGLITRTHKSRFQVLNRIAVEELEAWFFGDIDAIVAAYPGFPSTQGQKAGYRDPDGIRGGTWERLEKLLEHYHPGGLEKVRAAEEISRHMQPERNRSKSFQVFRDALLDLFEQAPDEHTET